MKSKTLLLLPTFATGTFLRVAIFDNDGTLWTEQPMYVQPAFALDRIQALAPQHPEWNTNEPFCLRAQGRFKRHCRQWRKWRGRQPIFAFVNSDAVMPRFIDPDLPTH